MSDAPQPLVLVVDDSQTDLEIISIVCASLGWEVDVAPNGVEAIQKFQERGHQLVLSDYVMEPMNGIYVVSKILELDPSVIALMMTGYPNAEVRRFSEEMSINLVTKPFQAKELKEKLRLALNRDSGAREQVSGVALSNRMDNCAPLASDNKEVMELRDKLTRYLGSSKPLLLVGPVGSGKLEIARFLHETGPRGGKSHIEFDCSDLTEERAHSELIAPDGSFGHIFKEAEGSTFILRHVSGLPLSAQRALASELDGIATRMHLIVTSDEALEDGLGRGEVDDEFYFRLTENIVELASCSQIR
jgi:DNA-binding NtrC family response regulator